MGSGGRLVLLGLMVTVGVTIGVMPPYLTTAVARYYAGSASDDVVDALREARALAATRGQPVHVIVDEDLRAVSVEGGSWRKLPSGVSLAGPKPDHTGRGFILFRPDGSSSGGQVVIFSHGSAVSVLVERADGRVRRIRAGVS